MLPELKPFFDAVQQASIRRDRAIRSSLMRGIKVWYRRSGEVVGPVVVAGHPRRDGRIPVQDGRQRHWIPASAIVSKGAPPSEVDQ